jgi:hypothetical protein
MTTTRFMPEHLEKLLWMQLGCGADVVYPRPADPAPALRFGQPFDPIALEQGNYVPVTVLTRTQMVRAVGGFQHHGTEFEDHGC